MKATLYTEEAQAVEPLNVEQQALADQPAEPVKAPEPELFIVNYKTLAVPTIIALVILAVWTAATYLL